MGLRSAAGGRSDNTGRITRVKFPPAGDPPNPGLRVTAGETASSFEEENVSIASSTVPVSAIQPGYVINLRADGHFDPLGDDPDFANDLEVHEVLVGPPATEVLSGLLKLKLTGADEAEEHDGITLVVSEPHQAVMVLYFVDDQRDIRFGFPASQLIALAPGEA